MTHQNKAWFAEYDEDLTPEEQLIEDEKNRLDEQSNDITAAEQKRIDDDEAEQQAIEAAWQEEFDAQLLEDMVAGDELDGGSWYQGEAHPDDYDFDRDHESAQANLATTSLGDLLKNHLDQQQDNDESIAPTSWSPDDF